MTNTSDTTIITITTSPLFSFPSAPKYLLSPLFGTNIIIGPLSFDEVLTRFDWPAKVLTMFAVADGVLTLHFVGTSVFCLSVVVSRV